MDKLFYREWAVIALVVGIILSLIAISWLSERRVDRQIAQAKKSFQSDALIAIEITGALKNPGTYFFKPGITLGEAVKDLELLKEADRRKIPKKRILFHPQKVEIPFRAAHKKEGDQVKAAQNLIVRKSKVLLASSL